MWRERPLWIHKLRKRERESERAFGVFLQNLCVWRENEREGCMNLHYVWTTNLGFCYNTALPVGSNAKRETYGLSYGMGKLLFDIYKYEHNVPQRNTDKSTYQKKKGTKINQRM